LDFRAHVLGAESALAETVSDLKLEAPSVIDAGCGSGILAVSAAKLGFRGIYAFDQDPEAATVTRENTERNNLEPTALEVRQAGLEDGLAGRRADLILANIISDVLVIYREPLVAATAPGGWLALSGILAPEADEVRERFVEAATAAWGSAPACLDQRVDGEWADVLLVRAG
ncbi:MAG: 50S ribosomal protein L11 methyltransferase, partial [Opitutales bacterium]